MRGEFQIRQSELIRLGLQFPPFPQRRYYDRARVGAMVLRSRGDAMNARLLDTNNPAAVGSLTFVNDVPVAR